MGNNMTEEVGILLTTDDLTLYTYVYGMWQKVSCPIRSRSCGKKCKHFSFELSTGKCTCHMSPAPLMTDFIFGLSIVDVLPTVESDTMYKILSKVATTSSSNGCTFCGKDQSKHERSCPHVMVKQLMGKSTPIGDGEIVEGYKIPNGFVNSEKYYSYYDLIIANDLLRLLYKWHDKWLVCPFCEGDLSKDDHFDSHSHYKDCLYVTLEEKRHAWSKYKV